MLDLPLLWMKFKFLASFFLQFSKFFDHVGLFKNLENSFVLFWMSFVAFKIVFEFFLL